MTIKTLASINVQADQLAAKSAAKKAAKKVAPTATKKAAPKAAKKAPLDLVAALTPAQKNNIIFNAKKIMTEAFTVERQAYVALAITAAAFVAVTGSDLSVVECYELRGGDVAAYQASTKEQKVRLTEGAKKWKQRVINPLVKSRADWVNQIDFSTIDFTDLASVALTATEAYAWLATCTSGQSVVEYFEGFAPTTTPKKVTVQARSPSDNASTQTDTEAGQQVVAAVATALDNIEGALLELFASSMAAVGPTDQAAWGKLIADVLALTNSQKL